MRRSRKILYMFIALASLMGCQPDNISEDNGNDNGGTGGGVNIVPGGEDEEEYLDPKYTASIFVEQPFGRVTDKFLFDIKQGGNTVNLVSSDGETLFGEFGMNGLRIPIYGDSANGGHTAEGVVGSTTYSKILPAINTALKYFHGDKFYIFASKKLDGGQKNDGRYTFPAWVKDKNGVVPEKYASMLMDYFRFMKQNGVEIDVLGIDNEENFNEGAITAEKYAQIVDLLKVKLAAEGFKIPLFLGHDRYNPERQANYWLLQLYNGRWQDRLDIYGTHYYPHHHVADFHSALVKEFNLANSDKQRPFWATEPHWDNDDEAKADMIAHAEKAMCTIFDQTDLGMDAFMWWSFKWKDDLRGNLMKHLSLGIYGSQPIKMTDHDGEDTMTLGRLQTRAFIRDRQVNAYLINVSNKGYEKYKVTVPGKRPYSVSATQWTDGSPITGDTVIPKIRKDGESFAIDIPKRSITHLTFGI